MTDALVDPRAYLQQRITLFSGVLCVFFFVVFIGDLATPAPGESWASSTRVTNFVALTLNAFVVLVARRRPRSMAVLRTLDIASVVVVLAALATLPIHPPVSGAGGVMVLFVGPLLAVVLVLRAAIVPSPPWLSAGLAFVFGVLATACSYWGWEGVHFAIPNMPDEDPRLFPLIYGGTLTAFNTFVVLTITRVVHGLQTRVREAMQLGQYTLETKIGEGGMGAVYRARHHMLRRPTAVKLLPPDKAGEAAIARFEREVQQTSRLTHPNTVAIYDFGRTQDGVFYYAMEYLDGISLEDLVEMAGPLPADRTIYILVQVAGSLAEAHAVGLVHRDIKPDNIILCERGGGSDVVKVVDFGLVKQVKTEDEDGDALVSRTDTIQGTPLYMAPESLRDPNSVDGRADIYALGAVGYFLLTAEPVFNGSVVEVCGHHLHTEPAPLRDLGIEVDERLENVIMRCLAKDPNDRYESADRLVEELHACADASGWSRARAQTWWTRQRDTIASRREEKQRPSTLTIARA